MAVVHETDNLSSTRVPVVETRLTAGMMLTSGPPVTPSATLSQHGIWSADATSPGSGSCWPSNTLSEKRRTVVDYPCGKSRSLSHLI
jgi:hypothetical protein